MIDDVYDVSNTNKLTKVSLTSTETGLKPPSSLGKVVTATTVIDSNKRTVGFTDSADAVMGNDINDRTKADLDKDKDDKLMIDFAK